MPVLNHPCFGQVPCGTVGRIHLPVAPSCNVQCNFCDRKYDCVNESRPGVTSELLAPVRAVERVRAALEREPRIGVAGIAGPGDALDNDETFETLKLVHEAFPQLLLCLSTNGLLGSSRLEQLLSCHVNTMTVTVLASTPATASLIYERIRIGDTWMPGGEAAQRLLEAQRKTISICSMEGIIVKVNTVLIPGINDGEIGSIARMAEASGASIMNVIGLIPCGHMSDRPAPTPEQLKAAQAQAESHLPVFTNCHKCRADACGML